MRRSDPLSYRWRQDSCLDHVEDTSDCGSSRTGRKDQCYSVPSVDRSKRRATIMSTSPGSSLLEISKSGSSGSNKFMTFFQKGFNMHKSKSSSKLEKEKSRSKPNDNMVNNLDDIVPIPIRETAIQGHSKTLFHKVPNSNLRAKPLIVLTEDTKIVPIHPSILSNRFDHCVKILSSTTNVYRESCGNKYELMLPSGVRSLGHTYKVITDDDGKDRYRSCHSSQLSLYSVEQVMRPTVGYVFSCNSAVEQKKWINVLTRVARPNQQNQRRKEISLSLWIQEAKNVPARKRYFCEIYLDGSLHARTTTKTMGDMLFWGEEFNLSNLEEVKEVTLLLWKCTDESRSKKKKFHKTLTCQIIISTKEIDQRTSVERWYSPPATGGATSPETPTSHPNLPTPLSHNATSIPLPHGPQMTSPSTQTTTCGSNNNTPMLRVKARYQHLDVLPLSSYSDLISFLNDNSVKTLTEIEPHLKVKAKEDLSLNLIKIIHKQGTAVSILCDLIVNEINKSDDKNLILRGNTMASKTMEIYLKLVGEKYLQLTLSDFINRVLLGHDDCEVDPQKERFDFYGQSSTAGQQSQSGAEKSLPIFSLQQRQESLMMNVDMIWAKIMSSSIYFPKDLKAVFITLRRRLQGSKPCQSHGQNDDQPDLCDRIISACIFLRYICPAILTPSLFGLIPEYPDNPKVTRTFTLVAKCIQTLANFSNLCGTKETYMVFMNTFIESNFKTMRDFLREISERQETEHGRQEPKVELPSSPVDGKECSYWESLSSNLPEDNIDMALCLATLHRQLEDCLQVISPQNFSTNLKALHSILEDLNMKLQLEEVPTIPGPVKFSSSYQSIRLQTQTHPDNIKRISLNEPEVGAKFPFNGPIDQKTAHVVPKHKHLKSTASRKASSHSHSAEATPTHQLQGKAPSTAEYLMTQSMMDSYLPSPEVPKNSEPMNQVEKDWKDMLTASNKCRELFFAEPTDKSVGSRSMTSSGYHTLSRSTESVGKPVEVVLVVPKSPTVSLKPSVKKCKQTRRQTDIISRPDTFGLKDQSNIHLKVKEHPNRSVSTEEIFHISSHIPLARFDDEIDFASTQTLIASNGPRGDIDAGVKDRQKLLNSLSLPAFHSNYDIETRQSPGFYSAFQEVGTKDLKEQLFRKPLSFDDTSGHSNGKSAFHDASKFKQPHHKEKKEPGVKLTDCEAETIKSSLNNIRQTLNSRMKQLLLSDRTTIQLELKRVKLMRQICDTSDINGSISLSNLILFNYHNPYKAQTANGNWPRSTSDSSDTKTISIKRYLDLAESVLIEAYNNQAVIERGNHGLFEREMEDFLVQIFQTNQYLQNKLMSKPGNVSNLDALTQPNGDHSSLNIRKGKIIYNVHKSDSHQSGVGNSVSKSLASSQAGPPSGTMTEIVDAV